MAETVRPPAASASGIPESPQPICASEALQEKGRACVFAVLQHRQPAHGFALRWNGGVVAYLNRCLHVPMEMDWQPGEFLDSRQEFILCATHGASYEPRSGRCASGPCGRGSLTRIEVEEREGRVWWIPNRDTRPVPPAAPAGLPVP